MSLGKQLLAVITTIYLMVFLGTLTIAVGNTRDFLNTQLNSHAQDTATSLGLSLSIYLADADELMMESAVDAIFDRGYFRSIVIQDAQGKPSIVREVPLKVFGVPRWFVDLLPLYTPTAKAPIMAGWRNGGEALVRGHPGFAYEELWATTIETLYWYAMTLLVAIALTIAILRVVLRPLGDVERQALAIARKDFSLISVLPRTRELRRVVEAMNQTTTKVQSMLAEQLQQSEMLRQDAYVDPTTGIGNSAGFERALRANLTDQELPTFGLFVLVRLKGLEEVNRLASLAEGDELLRRAAVKLRALDHRADFELARLGGSLFGLLVPSLPKAQTGEFLQRVIDSVGTLAMPGGVQGGAIAGATCFESGNDANELMLRAEHSLKEAPNRPEGWCTWEMLEDRSQPGATQEAHWTEILEQALEQRAVVLHFQPVLSSPGESLLHRETLARVQTSDGTLLPAGMFLPIASLVGLGTRIDRLVTELLLEHMSASADTSCRFAMNLSGHALNDTQFVDWLTTTLGLSGLASRVCVEVREATAIEHTQACIELAEALRTKGAGFGVDHCGGHNAGLEYVRQIKPDYMKIDGTFIKRLGSDPIQREYVRSLVTAAHGMDCLAIAEQLETQGDYEQIRALGFDGAQGHHLGYPQAEYEVGS